jgi:hypothetical protein
LNSRFLSRINSGLAELLNVQLLVAILSNLQIFENRDTQHGINLLRDFDFVNREVDLRTTRAAADTALVNYFPTIRCSRAIQALVSSTADAALVDFGFSIRNPSTIKARIVSAADTTFVGNFIAKAHTIAALLLIVSSAKTTRINFQATEAFAVAAKVFIVAIADATQV